VSTAVSNAPDALKRTPLYALHLARGGKMVPFAGYELPVQYAAGVLKEHLHTRAAASLFDVSHMGQIRIRAKSGRLADAALALERLMPQDIADLGLNRQRYAQLTNPMGGILDDLMVTNFGDHLFVVVNAARKHADLAHFTAALSDRCEVTAQFDRALLALQGPGAAAVLERLAPGAAALKFMQAGAFAVNGANCIVSRSGYTGEDGFEIAVAPEAAEALAVALLDSDGVLPAGLGARDSLRLEAGLCLHGHDIDASTTPVEAALEWSIQKSRRAGGARAGGFPGAQRILHELATGTPRRRVGLRAEGRAPVREGAPLFVDEAGPQRVGLVTSGGFGPSLNAPVAMGYVPAATATDGTRLLAEVRGQRLPVKVARLPFITPTYQR
jgi:aminomethyltransferase